MINFFIDAYELTFLQYALAAAILTSIACGLVGSFVVVRRISYLAGAIAHCVLGGIGAARYLNVVYGVTWITPFTGALFAALLAAMVTGYVTLRLKEREDSVISVIWASGMALGILFVAVTPGYKEDLMGYLFGNILLVSSGDLWAMVLLDFFIMSVIWLYYPQFIAVCFDQEFARIRGVKVEFYYMLLLVLTALTVVMLISVVGIVLVIALLTIPVAIAGTMTTVFRNMIVLSVLLSMAFTTGGLAVSYTPDLPSGAVTILLASTVWFLAMVRKNFLT
jgi:zinc transport system permease protein